VDITSAFETKARAIACHASQFGGGDTLIGDAVGGQAFAVRDRYWGASIGVAHGEPYLLGAPVPMSDPVAHFAAHPQTPSLVPPR
jgi:LmbE family N-acetylglucosaminyl deacetylase